MTMFREQVRADTPSPPVAEGSPSTRHGKRLDIQGLRAIAVIVVVINHLTGHPRGGFVGVDVFFVISGYLITGVLLRDLDEKPGVGAYLISFYKRRVRRLLPAALLVTVATLVAAHVIFTASRYASTQTDAIWSTVFLANWHFNAIGTNYFAAGRPQSPFQHYWSLSVEEQFYVFWPMALLIVVRISGLIARRHEGKAKAKVVATLLTAVAATAVSIVFAWKQTSYSPTSAYFSTFARAWELGLGAVLACATSFFRPPRALATAISLLGVGLVAASLFVVSQGSGFPYPGAILPCVGSALVLGGFPRGAGVINPLLTNRVSVLVGDLSYSVYLVHFPVIILLAAKMNDKDGYYYSAATLLIVGLSAVLFYGVEQPVLKSRFLAPRRSARTGSRYAFNGSGNAAAGLSLGVAVTFLGSAVYSEWPGNADPLRARYQVIQAAVSRTAAAAKDAMASMPADEVALQVSIRSALGATQWPALNPTVDQEMTRGLVPLDLVKCAQIQLAPAAQCTFGPASAKNTLYVVGDSTSMAYAEAYRQIVTHTTGWKVRIAAADGCNFDTVTIADSDPKVVTGCPKHNAAVIAEVERTHPTLIAVTDTYAARIPASGGAPLTDQQWTTDLAGELSKITGKPPIVLVEPAPVGPDPATCYSRTSVPVACAFQLSSDQTHRSDAERALAQSKGWSYVGTGALFCDLASDYCPEFADGSPIKHDDVHVAYAYDDHVWDVLAALMKPAGAP